MATNTQLIEVLELARDEFLWKGTKATWGRWNFSLPSNKERCVCYAIGKAASRLGIMDARYRLGNLVAKHIRGFPTMEAFLSIKFTSKEVHRTPTSVIQTYRVAMINNMIAILKKRSRGKSQA